MPPHLAILAALVLAGCASVPDPNDCRAYGVDTEQPFPGCATVEEYALPRAAVFARCHTWGCTHFVPRVNGVHCRVYWYEGSAYVRNEERCHARYGPRHVGPLTLDELLAGVREWARGGD